MTWLLTNDDGVFAPGIFSLFESVNCDRLLVVAPHAPQSGCGHQVTTTHPLLLQSVQDRQWSNTHHRIYAVHGTPVDCVRVGFHHLRDDLSFVLSGINDGANLGADIYISGTVAAVREAALLGLPGVALSQYRVGATPIRWDVTIQWTIRVLEDLKYRPLQPFSFWNVNFPHPETAVDEPEIILCPVSRKPLPAAFRQDGQHLHYSGHYADRDREPGSDVDVCFRGHIALTQITL
jgi:5'-nucleotidase